MSQVRDSLAGSAQRMDRDYPHGLDLLARLLVAISEPLRGAAGTLAGTHSDDAWREMLRGERVMPAYDICRLFESDHPRAARAADRLLAVLLARRNDRRAKVGLAEAAASLSREASDVVAAALRALEDGHATAAELDVIERELVEQDAAAAVLHQAIAAARSRA